MTPKDEINILHHFTKKFPLENDYRREFTNRELFYFIKGIIEGSKKEQFFRDNFKYFFVSYQTDELNGNKYFAFNGEFNMVLAVALIKSEENISNKNNLIFTFIREVSKEEYDENSGV